MHPSFVSVEIHFQELLLGEGEPELEVQGSPLWVEKDLEQSAARLLLQLQAILLEGVVLTVRVLQNRFHEETVVAGGPHVLHSDLEHSLRRFFLIGGATYI